MCGGLHSLIKAVLRLEMKGWATAQAHDLWCELEELPPARRSPYQNPYICNYQATLVLCKCRLGASTWKSERKAVISNHSAPPDCIVSQTLRTCTRHPITFISSLVSYKQIHSQGCQADRTKVCCLLLPRRLPRT
jgi:hypothetical protein